MSDHDPLAESAPSTARRRHAAVRPVGAPAQRMRFERGPDCRGETLDIFVTIFIRPALELRDPIRRMAHRLAGAGGGRRGLSVTPKPR